MFQVRRNEHVIAGLHRLLFPNVEGEPRRALGQQNPFILILVIPEIGRARLAVGNDPFDLYRARRNQGLDHLLIGGWEVLEKVVHRDETNRRENWTAA